MAFGKRGAPIGNKNAYKGGAKGRSNTHGKVGGGAIGGHHALNTVSAEKMRGALASLNVGYGEKGPTYGHGPRQFAFSVHESKVTDARKTIGALGAYHISAPYKKAFPTSAEKARGGKWYEITTTAVGQSEY